MSKALTTKTVVWDELRALPGHRLLIGFIIVAVCLRLIFWLYTGRTWEDAIISLTPARNLWDGFGLTHHASEPRVHSFTSGLGEIVLIIGEAVRAGLTTMRVVSIFAAAFALYYAFRVGVILSFHWSAQLLVLAYLAADHLQIFFGMGGMETQLATALVLANVYYYLNSNWTKLGIVGGLAVICRPELGLWGLILGAAIVLWHRQAFVKVAVPAILIAGVWFGFAALYYGSPIPHTITVKSGATMINNDIGQIATYLSSFWSHIAPFLQFWQVGEAPVPEILLQAVVALLLLLGSAGAVHAARFQPRMLAVLALLLAFLLYRAWGNVNPYFMWYMPPFVALLFLFAAAGISWLAQKYTSAAIGIACVLALAYSAPVFLAMPLDRAQQQVIEDNVRTRVGARLNELMSADDAVVLEPAGYVGWEIRPKTMYDFPGLTSPRAFEAWKKHHHMTGLIIELNPRFVVQRPPERLEFEEREPELAARYEAVETFRAEPGFHLSNAGLLYWPIDTEFTIYRRRDE
ncbi:hypothetical protein [Terricaulis silvestris]|uniref:Glycosyltransferase RgtA/B/C/D-like domain-containing protein n=1 Tax=Terricaulis silvestris TaxID=2686094 RepID=A0A6I6MQW1_9CAUL|nr:hypothetical protein [Terricaulis silvestris]QGZ96551.1 hypothetical protein DSM104635_03411 [Terricaulis silvestris]